MSEAKAYQCYSMDPAHRHYPVIDSVVELPSFFDVSLDYLVGRSDVKEQR